MKKYSITKLVSFTSSRGNQYIGTAIDNIVKCEQFMLPIKDMAATPEDDLLVYIRFDKNTQKTEIFSFANAQTGENSTIWQQMVAAGLAKEIENNSGQLFLLNKGDFEKTFHDFEIVHSPKHTPSTSEPSFFKSLHTKILVPRLAKASPELIDNQPPLQESQSRPALGAKF